MSAGWKLSGPQQALYWRLMGEAARAAGVSTVKEREALRRVLHQRAFGGQKSAKAMTNRDLDQFIAVVKALTQPDDLQAQLRQVAMPRTRLITGIRALMEQSSNLTEAYARSESERKFGLADWERLDEDDLLQLRVHLEARFKSKLEVAA